jgi:hypothetical protein
MFKKVEYVGFEGRPDLEAKARQLTPVLAGEVNTWRDDVVVRWSPHHDPATGVFDLALALTLSNGVEGEITGTFVPADFTRDSWLASRCRRVWSDLLGILLEKQHRRVEEIILTPAEA